ncbi:hypothetical protein GOA99_31360 [Sinorhizobium meliloti]|uniref:hypothetical protein n=1 Tax=Rhizobium meliloti TaxID=382 RepID=UPI00299D4684|nr:hypothetical protein [Sinorhizobium meliloti]MDW9389059.1 hypothetical protein [Sinorhizobium meliloti]MDW9395263.1 hypothetical protein [Sinorhizobium meliloti]MDW9546699.1 hypothetical protein [Sinorhizobium meliloti]MDW9603130.1 hypothetical protein [Sinorhizobium meliloti]
MAQMRRRACFQGAPVSICQLGPAAHPTVYYQLLGKHDIQDEVFLLSLCADVSDDEFWLALRGAPKRRQNSFVSPIGEEVALTLLSRRPRVTGVLEAAVGVGLSNGAGRALDTLFNRAALKDEPERLMPSERV